MLNPANSILSRTSFSPSPSLSPLQAQVDGLVTHFVDEAANPQTLAAITAGGVAYRMGRIGVMSLRVGASANVLWRTPLRAASVAIGLGSEVTAFEFTNRTLHTLRAGLKPAPTSNASPLSYSPNLWSWSGPGGWAQGLTTSSITFGMLKGAGFLAREQNIVFQHAFQSTAMVAGHNTVDMILYRRGVQLYAPTLAEQLLHAEATNLQLGAGMGLAHNLAPGIHAMERGLDLSLRMNDVGAALRGRPLSEVNRAGLPLLPNFTGAFAGTPSPRPSPSREREPDLMSPMVMMSSMKPGEGGTKGNWPRQISLNGADVTHNQARLSQALSVRAGKAIDAGRLISLLGPRLPGYRIGELIFQERSNGEFAIGGNIVFNDWMEVGSFERILFYNPDSLVPSLIAKGNGLQIHHETHRNKGLATQMTLGDLLFFREMGVSTFIVPVARKGGAFWPERGFDFIDGNTHRKKLIQFRDFLFGLDIELSPSEEIQLFSLHHSWELSRFRSEKGRPLGKEFLQLYQVSSWETRFDLHDSYPGWRVLRESLEKWGSGELLPPELGRAPSPLLFPGPFQISFEGKPLQDDFSPLDNILQKIAGRPVDSRESLVHFFRLPSGYHLGDLRWSSPSYDNLQWEGAIFDSRRKNVATYRRILYFSPQGLYPPFAVGKGLDVKRAHQQKGIGTLVALGDLLFLKSLGVKNFEVPVGREGGRFWPRIGFDFAHYSVGDEVVGMFQGYLHQNKIVLNPSEERALNQINSSWELFDFTLEDGRPIGREFLSSYRPSWDSHFVLSPTYPGWSHLRRGLQKYGYDSLLPQDLGNP